MLSKLKYFIIAVVVIDLILVFPVMLSYEKIGKALAVQGFSQVFVTLVVEITLLVLTSIIAYFASRILKGTALQKPLYFIAWGVLMYGVGDTHLLVWMYTGVESVYPFLGPASSSIAHAFGVGIGFIMVILGLYKIAKARRDILPNGQVG
ncbi:hypothetical protein C4572_04485 [Candidatus Parcubacteria bacterium]|nr:MAG: hypothetical protein C4572_04485 [Candidatus Parcubacteria bacterium]